MTFAYEQKMKFHKNIMGKATMHFGIGHDNPSLVEQNLLRYDACITCEDESIEPKGEVFKKMLDGGKCAVFFAQRVVRKPQTLLIKSWIGW